MKSFLAILMIASAMTSAYSVPVDEGMKSQSSFDQLLSLLQDEEVENQEMTDSVQTQWNNNPDQRLNVNCPVNSGQALRRIRSQYSPGHRDRRFQLDCARVADTPGTHCTWARQINQWDQPLLYVCPPDFYVSGMASVHNNRKEDRRWDVKCCKSKGYHTESCKLTDYINGFRQTFDYTPKEEADCNDSKGQMVFTGFHSYHSNHQEDRRWRVFQCKYVKNA